MALPRARLVALFLAGASAGCRGASSPGTADASRDAVVTRSVSEIRRSGNHLEGSRSVYLQQHAHNPVDWYPWGPEALARAVSEQKPIFLSIGYASCHWCHVMESEVFEKDDVGEALNDSFVSIKVDREERPDLDAAYMAAVQEISGGGGWPMTVFLTPSLHPFFGATYVPHDRFLAVVRDVAVKWRNARPEVERRGADVAAAIAEAAPLESASPLSPEEILVSVRVTVANLDARWGGLTGHTKFPTPIRWQMVLDAYRKGGDPSFAAAVKTTLDAMASGGIRDHVGGGFFRYATEPTWTVPHFEKMLYDNAQLASLYLSAAVALIEPSYRDVAVDTLDFMLGSMRTDDLFAASFDADSDGREGAYYLFTPAELLAVAGQKDGAALAQLLGATTAGNFEGKNVLTRRKSTAEVARLTGRSEAEIGALFEAFRPQLRDARAARPPPRRDKKAVTAWNALAVSAFARGYAATGAARFRDAAVATSEALWRVHRRPEEGLFRASNEGHGEAPGVLDDYAFLGNALVDLFQVTGELTSLERALTLAAEIRAHFARPAGGFFLTEDAVPAPMGRRVELEDGVEPSGASSAVLLLERLASLTGREDLASDARRALSSIAERARRGAPDLAGWIDDALLAAGPEYEAIVAGPADTSATLALLDKVRAPLAPWVVGALVPAEGPGERASHLMPPVVGKTARGGMATAYVCVRGACKAPTSDAATLAAQLRAGWAH